VSDLVWNSLCWLPSRLLSLIFPLVNAWQRKHFIVLEGHIFIRLSLNFSEFSAQLYLRMEQLELHVLSPVCVCVWKKNSILFTTEKNRSVLTDTFVRIRQWQWLGWTVASCCNSITRVCVCRTVVGARSVVKQYDIFLWTNVSSRDCSWKNWAE